MTYTIVTTPAFIINAREKAESSMRVHVFTRDIGRIHAQAQGVREGFSKLKYALAPFMHTRIGLVRGREVWRVVDAREDTYHPWLSADPRKYTLTARAFLLLDRFLGEEESVPELFDDVSGLYHFFDTEDVSGDERGWTEIILVLKVLEWLGYAPGVGTQHTRSQSERIFAGRRWDKSLYARVAGREREYIRAINESFEHSHL